MSDWAAEARAVDAAVYAAVAGTETPVLDVTMRRLSRLADHGKLWAALGAALALSGEEGRRAATRGLLALGLASTAANLLGKPLGGRRRPDRERARVLARRQVPMPRSSSFPSGHTASAFAFATAAGSVRPELSATLRALATLVGYSRVHTGVHYPADVLAGAFIGVTVAELSDRLVLGNRR